MIILPNYKFYVNYYYYFEVNNCICVNKSERRIAMGTYLGIIAIKNRYVNFKPLYEFLNGEFHFINQYDRQALLPDSAFGDINFYSGDFRQHVEDIFIDDTYCLLDFETDELEDNITNGVRNQTGYKLDAIEKLKTGKIYNLSDIDYYYVLPENGIEGSYKSNPILEVIEPYAYEGLKVVIPITEEKNTVIGPFSVELREHDNKFVIRTGLQTQKHLLHGYQFPAQLGEYTQQVGRFGDEHRFLHLDKSICKETTIDVITNEQLLTAFRDSINSESFVNGKVDLSSLGDFLTAYKNSPFIGNDIPEDIQKSRFETLSTLLTDEVHLNETFGLISTTITGLLDKYQDSEQYSKLIRELADNPDFMAKIQRFQIITDRIEKKQEELDELSVRAKKLQQQLEEEKRQEYAANLLGEYEDKIQELKLQKDKLDEEISGLKDELGDIKTGVGLKQKLADLEDQVDYKDRRERELDSKLKEIDEKLDSIFANSTEKALKFSFDGMLANRMLQQAAEWENQQNAINYSNKIEDLKGLTVLALNQSQLLNKLIEDIQKYRPSYDKNTIINILICYTQGFLTVFSGEPGTGKTSICRILASVLGLTAPEKTIPKYKDGFVATRFIPVSVERGWTTKRDFIGYYNPLTKAFDRSNRKIFDALNIMNLEANGNNTDMPFMILLDEANLSPMEYYWADFMNICDEVDCTSIINLGDDFCFNIPEQLRFVATINNDHTTESLSPRLIDRAWVIKLPRVKTGMTSPVDINTNSGQVVAWSSLISTFGVNVQTTVPLNGAAKDIYEELLNKCRAAKINVSARVDAAIRRYWSTAQGLFENDSNYGTDASIVALDYAISQRILPHISGSGEKYRDQLAEIKDFCSEKNLRMCSEVISEIIQTGEDSMLYFQFFS